MSRRWLLGALTVAALVGAPGAVRAEDVVAQDGSVRSSFESSRNFFVEINGGRPIPAVSRQPSLELSPYHEVFGKGRMWMLGAEFDWQVWNGFGSVGLGFGADIAWVSGKGIVASTGEQAPDGTSLKTIPLRLLAVYRFDWLSRRFNIPLVPFGKVGFANTIWWITKGDGSIARFGDAKALGGKWGYELTAGLAFHLNFIDSLLAREMDREFGVNSVYIHALYQYISADNFGREGMDLSTGAWMFGLGLEF